MAKISLRAYIREIEGLVEGGHLDEAVAHCQHILKIYPMHVETYKLLGKAFLEGRQFTDASDIFQRVLMAVPDDFISHVGMSIIKDDEGKLDESIWHMERAFEVQPSNSAIQGELRRLYGKRDGVEPTKIRLSRDALANMYSQGELFNQAIAEIRSVLAGDPNRPDLQVMLARAYYFAGKKIEAADMAATLLNKYPYCLDALRVLVEILSDSENAEKVSSYRQRLRLLDPYSAFVTGNLFETDKVADSTVNVDKLDYDPHSLPTGSQPAWASSLGIKMEDEKGSGGTLNWMKEIGTTNSREEEVGKTQVPAENEGAKESVPDWMRNASISESTDGETRKDEETEEPLAQAEIPDWLKSKIPEGFEKESVADSDEKIPAMVKADETLPEWNIEKTSGKPGIPPLEPSLSDMETTPVESIPDKSPDENWLKDLDTGMTDNQKEKESHIGDNAVLGTTPSTVSGEKPPEALDDTLGWLKDLPDNQGSDQTPSEEFPEKIKQDIPDWLKSGEHEQDEEQEPGKNEALESKILEPEEEKPAMQSGGERGVAFPESFPSIKEKSEPEKSRGEEDDTLSWLKNLGENQEESLGKQDGHNNNGVKSLTSETDSSTAIPEMRKEADLSWLSELVNEVPPTATPENLPEGSEANETEKSRDWMNQINIAGKKEEPLPDWLQEKGRPDSQEPPTKFEPRDDSVHEGISTWFDETAPVPEEAVPTGPAEWLPVDKTGPAVGESDTDIEAPNPDIIPERFTEKQKEFKGEKNPVKIPPQEKETEILQKAQAAFQGNSLDTALSEYGKLIKRGRLLDEVIHDLREGVYQHPVDVIVWQTLGDAYMRANRLQDALDAYTKAEELLR